MKRARAVIGSAWGDEGKGLMVDYFCRQAQEKPIVVRYNGGAQAGHTVVMPEGKRHVFHHFGAGFFAGADTYLSKYFLVNPTVWLREARELINYSLTAKLPRIYAHTDALVTTIYDMFVNQKLEESRSNRHGSCGMGVHETMLRSEKSKLTRLTALDLGAEIPILKDKLDIIRHYAIGRMSELNLLTGENLHWLENKNVFAQCVLDCSAFVQANRVTDDTILHHYNDAIFEGAQGLLLDQDNKRFFPHVTHSKTGLHNVIEICKKAGIEHVDACYVARSYLTRHGAGELPGEDPNLKYEDNTNQPNDWQGSLRFAPQDWDLLNQAISDDFNPNCKKGIDCDVSIAITHLDQCPITTPHYLGFRMLVDYQSYGPTWKDVRHDKSHSMWRPEFQESCSSLP